MELLGSKMKKPIKVFLSYAREDKQKVKELHQKLLDAGFKPWMDTEDILPGKEWLASIQRAIHDSDFFLACLSSNSVNKEGVLLGEINEALDVREQRLGKDNIYLIPVRLEDCEIPKRLRPIQWVDMFGEDGWARLKRAICMEAGQKPPPYRWFLVVVGICASLILMAIVGGLILYQGGDREVIPTMTIESAIEAPPESQIIMPITLNKEKLPKTETYTYNLGVRGPVDLIIAAKDQKDNLIPSDKLLCKWSGLTDEQNKFVSDGECTVGNFELPTGSSRQIINVEVTGKNRAEIKGTIDSVIIFIQ